MPGEKDIIRLLYDRYDIWQVAPDGSNSKIVTDGWAAREIEFRYARLDPQEKAVDPSHPMLLRAENDGRETQAFIATKLMAACRSGSSWRRRILARLQSQRRRGYAVSTLRPSRIPDLLVGSPDFNELKT